MTDIRGGTHAQNRLARSMASSREKAESSPVKTKDNPARQSGAAAAGMGFEPGLDGPANLAALTAAQLQWPVNSVLAS